MDDQTSSPPQRHVSNLDQFYISKTFFQPTPLTSSRPSSSSSSTTPTTAVHTSPTHESNEKSSTSTSPMDESTNVPVMPLNDEELLRHKRYFRRQPLMINGDNVTADNIEDGYVQFILHHDTDTIGDGIDGLMYARRKFSSVPRTGDLSYTTWDIFVLVNKLHNGEIKNWSQLVGQLGLSDMLGRPQFAQRVKRWMHKYKIDYYFDYLMGTPFNFHSVDEKYSGCLLMGNYQKRKEPGDSGDESSSQPQQKRKKKQRLLPSSTNHVKMEYDDDDLSIGEDDKRPILMAGSRKRMQGSTLLVNGMQRHVNDTDDEEEDDDDDDNNMYNNNNEEEEEEEEQEEEEEEEEDDTTPQQHRKVHQEKELDDDEEDELASTSSTSGSPIISTSSLIHHSSSLTKTAGPSTHHLTSHKPICDSCNQLSSTVEELRAQLKQISQQMDMISSWKPAMEEQCRLLEQQVNSLTKEKETIQEQWTSWRKKIVQDLLGDPFH
ncbi:ARS binding protein 2-domain-containing protein [Halteromyces radiatus]|uniref:ARS binding protein 2-domain-containing protein n=1 Tax=Halteromyces radiatus TaxID=101107 RepID=UPI0022203141|nr:ARS binding protein 2-domain-containing protein [Halteromyces radiatus]KAI8096295.1 ARS binding protein 2-domain-containing protein [Halteromyces radiatus]